MRWLGWLCCVVVAASCGRRDFNDQLVDAPTVECTEPPAGCMEPVVYQCGGTCYAKCRQQVSRATAAAACADWGGCLAVASDQNANDCAGSRLAGDVAWFGYLQPTTATLPAQDWSWCDGSPVGFTAWKPGQPDDSNLSENGEQNCAQLLPDGSWTDDSCGINLSFVCSR